MSVSIADLDDDFTKAKEPQRKQGGGLEALPDGEYEFHIDGGEVKETKAGPMVKLDLVVLAPGAPHDGAKCEHTYFLTKNNGTEKNENQIAQLKKDLATLGFDVDNWTRENQRPFSKQLDLALGIIGGVQFKGKKKANSSGQKTFHNLYVNQRSATDGKPETFGPEQLVPPSAGFDV
jgi:hypothetical protein